MATPLLVAIIGSGVGAASTSYFLAKVNPNVALTIPQPILQAPPMKSLGDDVSIKVFEKEPALSGRTRSVTVDGRVIELGASIAYTGASSGVFCLPYIAVINPEVCVVTLLLCFYIIVVIVLGALFVKEMRTFASW